MESLFIFIFLAYGITNILVFGSILSFWREFWLKHNSKGLGKLFTCPMCLSFWVGFGLSYLFNVYGGYSPICTLGITDITTTMLLDGFFTSGSVWFIHTIQEYFEK